MLISLNWIRDFVDLPPVSAADLADRFTLTCAEVEDVHAVEIAARGLICGRVTSVQPLPGDRPMWIVTLDVGRSRSVETVTTASNLRPDVRVVYAAAGASVKGLGAISDSTVAGRRSAGLIPPGDALGIPLAAREALFLPPSVEPGAALDPSLFEDWVIEIDNHSLTHRPDLWGHYGVAREIAAMFDRPLKPYPAVPLSELADGTRPELAIRIADPDACPRYSGLLMRGVESQPAPLWMQLRLGHVGMRPIDGLVDLTNYIMAELGQPMHAFDGDKVDRIEVAAARAGDRFTTLDGVERTLPEGALMILSGGRPVALAGIMGGAATEVSPDTRAVLLESANFHPHVIRKTANLLSHRTDASTRFEKSLDPNHTVLAIQRFVYLARREYPKFQLASRLGDAYPKPLPAIRVRLNPADVRRYMEHPVSREDIGRILRSLQFGVSDDGDGLLVDVPSFRATRDIALEVDLIEEVARCVGFNNIVPAFPEVTVRALDPNPLQRLERAALRYLVHLGMTEVYAYLWYQAAWCDKLGYAPGPCLTLRNPAAAGLERLRQSLMPGLLHAADLNRHHLDTFRLVELGSAFPAVNGDHRECRRVGLLWGDRGKTLEDQRLAELKGLLETWSCQCVALPAAFHPADADPRRPWEQPHKIAAVQVGCRPVGRVGAVPLPLRRRIDEHLAAWSFVWAEIDLEPLAEAAPPLERPAPIPSFPEVDLDFSVLVDAHRRYVEIVKELGGFEHPLLRRISFVDSYEGASIPAGQRALTFRVRIADPGRTLVDADLSAFRAAVEVFLQARGMRLRS